MRWALFFARMFLVLGTIFLGAWIEKSAATWGWSLITPRMGVLFQGVAIGLLVFGHFPGELR